MAAKDELLEVVTIQRPDGKVPEHVLGQRCHCVRLNMEEGTITFRRQGESGIEFTLPAFGPDRENVTDRLGIQPGDECWVKVIRFVARKPERDPKAN